MTDNGATIKYHQLADTSATTYKSCNTMDLAGSVTTSKFSLFAYGGYSYHQGFDRGQHAQSLVHSGVGIEFQRCLSQGGMSQDL